MKKTLRVVTIILSLILFSLSLCSCGSESEDIIGTWVTTADFEGGNVILSYEFFEDGTGRYEMEGFSADRFTYEVKGSVITLTSGNLTTEIQYSFEKDILILEIENQSVRFEKAEN